MENTQLSKAEEECLRAKAFELAKTRQPVARSSRLESAYAYWGWRGCVVPGCKNAVVLHHMVPRREGGTNGLHNLLPICKQHEEPLHAAGHYARTGRVPRTSKQLKPRLAATTAVKATQKASVDELPHTKRYVFGCEDCGHQYSERPSFCGVCKASGESLSQRRAPTVEKYVNGVVRDVYVCSGEVAAD